MSGKVIHFNSLLVKLQLLENFKEKISDKSRTVDVALRRGGVGVHAMPPTPRFAAKCREIPTGVKSVSPSPAKEEPKKCFNLICQILGILL